MTEEEQTQPILNPASQGSTTLPTEASVAIPEPEKPAKRPLALSLFALLSLITGLGTFVWFFMIVSVRPLIAYITAPLIALIAVLCGHRARRQIRLSSANMKGKHIAKYGLLAGYGFLLCCAFVVALLFLGIATLKGISIF